MENKRMKMTEEEEEEKEDRISDLPDSLIHHILSFLPSTKEAVQTGILSKRWENQWTQVPVLIFDSASGMTYDHFLKFIDNTLILHDCSNIKKFLLIYRHNSNAIKDPHFSARIRFATSKNVKKLILHSVHQEYILPAFLFKNASSLLLLRTSNCSFMPNLGKVNWKCLTTLVLESCRLSDQAMELVLSGTPRLQIMLLTHCFGFTKMVIASNSLKKLLLLGRSRPNIFDLEISCPKLEKVHLLGLLNVRNAKLWNLPSSLYADIYFHHHKDECNDIRMSLIKDILQQLQHVKLLNFGKWFMEYVSAVLAGGQFSPVLNAKSLTLKSHNISGIVCLLCKSPVLEILAIDVRHYDQDYHDFGENYWSDATVFSCLASHLKTIKIVGFPKRDGKHKVMLNFIQFFLKNARVLEKMGINLKDDGTGFALKVSQELLSMPRCSQYAIIELTCSK